jgi:type II secretory pathway predicted ATPase ExeA
MITAYWEIKFNPFSNSATDNYCFESDDFKQTTARLKHLFETKGIGLFVGNPGTGKTRTIKTSVESLNPGLFKVFYAPLSSVTVLDFYKAIAIGLGVNPPHKKIDLFNTIQERIISLAKDKRITPVIVCDEAQHLSAKILSDLKILLNFDMDSVKHAVLILAGSTTLATTLSLAAHEALAQRILINYTFTGLSKDELADYITSKLKDCDAKHTIFQENALNALWDCCSGSLRVINSLAENCLRIGAQKGVKLIDPDIVFMANTELQFV